MFKIFKMVVVLFISFTSLLGCSETVETLEDVDLSFYKVLTSTPEFIIYELIDKPEVQISICIGYGKVEEQTCCLGNTGVNTYLIEYQDDIYSLDSGYKLELFNTEKLIELGVPFNCN